MARVVKVNCALVAALALLLMTHQFGCSEAKRSWSTSNRKTGGSGRTPSSSNSGHVTKPSYPTQSGSNSQSDLSKLSYPSYNAAANSAGSPSVGAGAHNSQPIGWNVPKQQGPPPAYSASNPVGGAHTNMHEAAPAYRPSNSAPPSYGASNVHTPITATNAHSVQSSYPGGPAGLSYGHLPAATYHAPGAIPAGATYYPSAGHIPAGGSYYPAGGHMPAGATYYPGGGVPAGATYIPAGAALPAGATYYSQPPQQSSGLGFGSGLAAGAIGGALLGHALTPTQTRVVEAAPAAGAGGSGDGKVIIINNGPPGSVTTSGDATVINAGAQNPAAPAAGAAAAPAAAAADPAVPNVPLAPMVAATNAMNPANASATPIPATDAAAAPAAAAAAPDQPPAGGIICVPVRVNETDPADSSKMVEVEKIACYPAPPPPPPAPAAAAAEMNGTAPVAMPAADGAPLAPFSAAPGGSTQQLQQNPAHAATLPENAQVRAAGNGANVPLRASLNMLIATLLPLLCAYFGSR